MKRLMMFEFKRMIRNKMLYLTLVLILMIGILGHILNIVFNSKITDPRYGLLSLYSAYTQFTYLMCGYVFVYTFSNDFSNGINIFINQIGYSMKKIILAKTLLLTLIVIPLVDIIFLVMNLIYGNNDYKYLILLISVVDLGIIFIILLAIVLSLFLKKTMPATLILYGLFIIFNISNLFLYGLTNPADGNSISTYVVQKLIGANPGNLHLDKLSMNIGTEGVFFAILVPLIWIIIFNMIVILKIRKKG